MKTIGLIGGMSVESSIKYYEIMTRTTNNVLGKHHSPQLVIVSVDSEIVIEAIHNNRWDIMSDILIKASRQLESAGVDFIAIACNSVHKVAPDVQKHLNVPFIHILQPVLEYIQTHKIKKIGLMGTKFTTEDGFYQKYLGPAEIETIIPPQKERDEMHRIIFDELVLHIFKDSSQQKLLDILHKLQTRGAEAIILGCTELPLILSAKDASIPVLNTTEMHAKALAFEALKSE